MLPDTTTIQSLHFCKRVFTPSQARSWARAHGFRAPSPDITPKQIRLRQKNPDRFQPGSFRTIELKPGLWTVVGRPMQYGNPGHKGTITMKLKNKKHAKGQKRRAALRQPATHHTATNDHTRTRVKLELKAAGQEMGTDKTLYHAYLVEGASRFYLGHVTARTQADGKRKARVFLRRKIG